MKKLMLISAALLLAACGSDSDDPGPPRPPPVPPPDAFYTRLDGMVGNAAEDTEPVDVSEFGKTEPEETEPVGG